MGCKASAQLYVALFSPRLVASSSGAPFCTLSATLLNVESKLILCPSYLKNAEHEIQTADSSPMPGRLPGKQLTALKGTGGAWAEAPL